MGFFGIGKKKGDKKYSTKTGTNSTKNVSKTSNQDQDVKSPAVTEASQLETPTTTAETPESMLSSLSVLSGTNDECLEIVMGNTDTSALYSPSTAPTDCDEDPPTFKESPTITTPDHAAEEVSGTIEMEEAVADDNTDFDEPFDQAEFHGPEDPTILEIQKAASNEDVDELPPPPPPPLPDILARRLIDAFNCESNTTSDKDGSDGNFYDGLCGTKVREKSTKRPYFDKQFTLAFLKEATQTGVPLLYHLANTNEEVWTGRSVTMFIRLGDAHGPKLIQPQLIWTTMGTEPETKGLDLLDIQNVLDSTSEDDVRDNGEVADMCFFSVTTNKGEVHLFEATSYEERDRVVNGIKNVIARLSFHLVAGNAAISSELYSEDSGQMSGELPSLRTPAQAMIQISHAFLDSDPA